MRINATFHSLAIVAAGVGAALSGTGCIGPPVPVPEREEFRAIRASVSPRPGTRLEVEFTEPAALEAPPTGDGVRAASVPPETGAQRRAVVGALRGLGAFGIVEESGVGGTPSPPDRSYRLVIAPRRSEAEYLGMSMLWPVSFMAWWGTGPPGWFFPDERYEARVGWDVRVLAAATGAELASTRIDRAFSTTLNDFDRGFSLWDIFVYYARPVDDAVLQRVGGKLLPHAEADATLALCRWVVSDVLPIIPAADGEPVTPPAPPPTIPEVGRPGPGARRPAALPVPEPEPRTFVLCLGVGRYATDRPARHAAADATAMATALTARLALPGNGATLLVDGAATQAAMRAWLDDVRGGLTARDRVWIYFAGRGATDEAGEPWLLPHDAEAASPAGRGIPLREIGQALGTAGRVTLLLDCAFQGRVAERGPGSTRAPAAAAGLVPPVFRILAAAYGEGEATSSDRLGHGAFTHALLAALDAPPGAPDGRSLQEVAARVATEARRTALLRGVLEQPALVAGDPAGLLWPEGR